MSETPGPIVRFPLLDALRSLGKGAAAIEASVVTTFNFDAAFYEEVLLRAFERAGSRLNIVLVDARQLSVSVDDPLRQPTRAGKDYLLAPVSHTTAFHPTILALLSEKSSVLSIGSHNAADPGFSHNEEVTTFWGTACKSPRGACCLMPLSIAYSGCVLPGRPKAYCSTKSNSASVIWVASPEQHTKLSVTFLAFTRRANLFGRKLPPKSHRLFIGFVLSALISIKICGPSTGFQTTSIQVKS